MNVTTCENFSAGHQVLKLCMNDRQKNLSQKPWSWSLPWKVLSFAYRSKYLSKTDTFQGCGIKHLLHRMAYSSFPTGGVTRTSGHCFEYYLHLIKICEIIYGATLHNNWPKIAYGIRAYNRLRFALPSTAEKVVAMVNIFREVYVFHCYTNLT